MTVSTGPRASVELGQTARTLSRGPVGAVLLHAREGRTREAVLRVALAAGVEVRSSIAAADGRSFVDLAQQLRDAHPDVVIARVDRAKGDELATLVEAVRLGCAAQRPMPHLFVLGDARAAATLATRAAPIPGETFATDADAVAALRALRRRDDETPPPRAEETERAARNIASLAGTDTLVVDVGGMATSCVLARPAGEIVAVHAVPLGVGAGADRVVADGGIDRVRRWLPTPIDAPALLERVFNRARWPDAVPTSPGALALEMALAREAIARALLDGAAAGLDVTGMRAAPVVALGGRLAAFPRAAQSLIVAVDAVEPTGLATIIRERAGTYETVAVVAPLWPRRSAVIRLRHAGGETEQRVARGGFFLMPAKGRVELTATGANLRGTVEAGGLGLLVDARGRPVDLPQRDAERIPTLARWHAAVSALPV